MEFESVIGLEVHAQLSTESKLFCSCAIDFGQEPNKNTCPVCLGLPGVLPTINEKAVRYAVLLGLATHCTIRTDSQFARKNYFYPDLPKAYQTSQFDRPLCENGWVDIEVEGEIKRIGITRIHMEEDAGKLVHEGDDPNASYIDLNRAGTPLVEIVSEPDLRTSAEAKAYMEKIHSIVTYLRICNGNMEKGNLRCDANVSIRPMGQKELGIRTETKNLNSFRNVQAAIDYEIERQTDATFDGEPIIQQTRLWNADRKVSKAMRSKEDSDDYRYFPCPDLPVIAVEGSLIESLRAELPELPDEKGQRFQDSFQLSKHDASMLVANRSMADYFEAVLAHGVEPKAAANWVMGDMSRLLNEHGTEIQESQVTADKLAGLIKQIDGGIISGKIAKTVFEEMFQSGQDAETVITKKGLKQVSDSGELTGICENIITDNPAQAEQFRAGKEKVMGFFVGQVMQQTKGKANPQMVNQILKKLLTP
ncbi:MAG: Asp-tRNA(Asn)/Glu-tRNA(Gln) amidotransferase subunit GatB [Deltaproteobacteria bacterium]|nr:Asp-tRNA(Asn)/Glu-tRNA(Gln) amidotransferase subunit GatB [Deltaproteobacteria bacterium]MBT4637519.1 Asp-tRNA(Asn)/Glu-tRNA(Gln) amidotransferase subunit GatB [Deltaproteobacteria bacterium]MBT6504382.1 Asp-tRNA(Asn)/Glu-tRNA(Gln) amidotransferase subunit GatB [Deltaproteobacteria bacterium]MBT7152712.1 Asp-tRNA(Asn)/Glu-tRNA(Gln) amidotransferase subunit GatB [Deltaproteobacteria bacterium]MBT7712078.1 Asp-tRNA(Asn)/Glu-tRNA(Gln) amidotransferase subunit GatB [Deltaproteobacteria bacterium